MSEGFNYSEMVRHALTGVVKRVLSGVADSGLPGEHHFYISFKTRHPGVVLPGYLRAQFPDEMTVVMQHQFRDLVVHDKDFEVGLYFGGKPEHIVIPFDALISFYDPSVSFGLKLRDTEDEPGISEGVKAPDIQGTTSKEASESASNTDEGGAQGASVDTDNVVNLDVFRKN